METIVIYGTAWCSDCITAKSILDSYNVRYTFVNIDQDDEGAARVMEINGGRKVVPTIFIESVAYTNPSQLELIELIEPYVRKKAS